MFPDTLTGAYKSNRLNPEKKAQPTSAFSLLGTEHTTMSITLHAISSFTIDISHQMKLFQHIFSNFESLQDMISPQGESTFLYSIFRG